MGKFIVIVIILLALTTSTDNWTYKAKLPLRDLSGVGISVINTRLSQQDISRSIRLQYWKGNWKPVWSCSVRGFQSFHIPAYFSGIRTLFKDFRTCCSKLKWWHTLCSVCVESVHHKSRVLASFLRDGAGSVSSPPKKLLNNSFCPSFCPLVWYTGKTLLLRAVDRYNTRARAHTCTQNLHLFKINFCNGELYSRVECVT